MKKLLIVIILGIIASSAYSQNSLRAYRLSKAIKIDGIFEPESWVLADSATSFVQMEPVPGDKSSESTVAWFGYDESNIYAVINVTSQVL